MMTRHLVVLAVVAGLVSAPAAAEHERGHQTLFTKENIGKAVGAAAGALLGTQIGSEDGRRGSVPGLTL